MLLPLYFITYRLRGVLNCVVESTFPIYSFQIFIHHTNNQQIEARSYSERVLKILSCIVEFYTTRRYINYCMCMKATLRKFSYINKQKLNIFRCLRFLAACDLYVLPQRSMRDVNFPFLCYSRAMLLLLFLYALLNWINFDSVLFSFPQKLREEREGWNEKCSMCVFMETVRIFCGLNKFLAWFYAHRRNLYFYDLAFLKCMRWKSRPCIISLFSFYLMCLSVFIT